MKSKFVKKFNLFMEELENDTGISDDQLKKVNKYIDNFAENLVNDKEIPIKKFDRDTHDKVENVVLRDNNLSKEITSFEEKLTLGDFSDRIISLSSKYPKSYRILMDYLKNRDDENGNIGIGKKIAPGIYDDILNSFSTEVSNSLTSDSDKEERKMSISFLSSIVDLKGRKNGAAVGPGEVFLALYFKNGSLSDDKGDVKIGEKGGGVPFEIKTPDGKFSREAEVASMVLDDLKKLLINDKKLNVSENDKNSINAEFSKNGGKRLGFSFKTLKKFSLINKLSGFKNLNDSEKIEIFSNFLKLLSSKCSVYLSEDDVEIDKSWFNLSNDGSMFKDFNSYEQFLKMFTNKIFIKYREISKFKYFGLFDYKINKLKVIDDTVDNVYDEFTFLFPTFGGGVDNQQHNVLVIKSIKDAPIEQ